MTMFASQWLANAGSGYEIDQSIRFNDDDAAYLTRTPGSDGNLKTWTYSVWFKRGAVGSGGYTMMSAGADNTNDMLFYFGPAGEAATLDIFFRESSTIGGRITSFSSSITGGRLFRDPSAWMHFVLVWDTTNSTSADRLRLYINGERATTDAFAITEPSLNDESRWNTARANLIGKMRDDATNYFDGYMAEINFIDGTALTAASFGETNDEGVWIPTKYSGAYGTNGFYLKGQDSSALGDDSSGNGNDFTSSGLAAADQMSDSPTNNYCVMSPIDKSSAITTSNGNLVVTDPSTNSWNHGRGTLFAPSGKWYYEWTPTAGSYALAGWMLNVSGNDYVEEESDVATTYYRGVGSGGAGFKIADGTTDSSVTLFGLNDVVMMAIDVDTMKMWVGIDGTWYNSGDPANGTNPVGTWTAAIGESVAPWYGCFLSTSETFNFGASSFAHTIPTGFNAWNTANLPTPTISDGSAYFHTQLYTGNGSSGLAITNDANAGDFQPDLWWLAPRSNGDNHVFIDVARGQTQRLKTNSSDAEYTDSPAQITFETDGFDLDTTDANFNGSGRTYVAWQWETQGGAGSSNEDGSINTTTTSVNQTAGISLSTYTGTGSNATVGHGLGAVPKMIIVKERSDSRSWVVYHKGIGDAAKVIYLNQTAAAGTDAAVWNSTAPTSSVFSVGTANGSNGSSNTYVAYVFAEVPGYSSIGSYTGNGSTDGPFVYTGFRPAWLLVKRAVGGTGNWDIFDNKRDPFNVVDAVLDADNNTAETTYSTIKFDFLSNGFKVRGTQSNINASGSTYIYMAFAENPFGGDGAAPATAR